MNKWVVVIATSDRQVVVMGSRTGRVFGSERAAAQAATRWNKRHPLQHGFVVQIDSEPES